MIDKGVPVEDGNGTTNQKRKQVVIPIRDGYFEISDEDLYSTQLLVAQHSISHEDCRDLLEALGILPRTVQTVLDARIAREEEKKRLIAARKAAKRAQILKELHWYSTPPE